MDIRESSIDNEDDDDVVSLSTEDKLTDWPNEPKLTDLKTDYDMAKPSHDTLMTKIKEWNDLRNVEGKHKLKKLDNRSSIQPKLIRRQAEWRYSALTEPFHSSKKMFSVSPETFEDVQSAKQNELLLNNQFRTKINRIRFIDDFVRSTHDDGTCIVQVGWERVTTQVEEEVPIYEFYEAQDQAYVDQFSQALELKTANPRFFDEQVPDELKQAITYYEETGTVTTTQVVEMSIEKVDKVLVNKPTLFVHEPANVIIDPTCNGDFEKALFVVVSFETNKAELQKKGIYKNLDRVNWENAADPTTEHDDHKTKIPSDARFNDAVRKKVVAKEYWGFWDINNDGELAPIVATWVGDTIIRMELNPFPDEQLPFVLVPYMPIKRELYGETDAELLADNQKILGAVLRGMIDSMGRTANGQQGFAKGLLDPLNRRKYDQGKDYEFNPTGNPQSHIIKHDFPEVPQSAITMIQLQNQEAEALSGVKSFSGGISGNAYGDVAAGIKGMLDASAKREMAILRRLADGMTRIGKKILAMNSIFLSEEEVVRVTNEEFVTVKREDLKGNFDLIVDIATAEVDEAKSQDLGFMLQTLGPNMDQSITMMILSEIADLKRMPDLAKQLKNYKPPEPSPLEQKMAELEVALKEAELQKAQSEIELNKAKAKKEMSIADKTDLEYVEQETGTKHARDMDKQRGQAQGNQDLEITKALTKTMKPEEKRPNVEAAIGYNMVSDAKSNPAQSATMFQQ